MKFVVMLDSIDLHRDLGIDMLEILAYTYDPPSNGSVHRLWDLHRAVPSELMEEYGPVYGDALVKIKNHLRENMPEWTDQQVYIHCSW